MSEERRKINKHSTGTVPKTKYRNNTSYGSQNDRDGPQSVTNNFGSEWHHSDYTNFIRNPRRNVRNNYFPMDTTIDDFGAQSAQPDCSGNVKLNSNDASVTPNTSSSTSRRNSAKCDNVAKYPDRKQIEDKLKQIREYLRITNSLMSSMKNTDEQLLNFSYEQYDDQTEKENLMKMVKDLTDSEAKLLDILEEINESERNVNDNQISENGEPVEPILARRTDTDLNTTETATDAELLMEHQRMLLRLQQKAENKLRDARQIQDKLLMAACENDVNYASNSKLKNCSEHDFDAAIKELEERAKRLNEPRPSNVNNMQDKLMEQVEGLHNELMTLRSANDERSHLIEMLDNRDTQLHSQQMELQNKLHELQSKKLKVDQLMAQLQDFNEVEDDDEVRNIVNIKGQLKKLKEMLDIVKTTENIINTNGSSAENDGDACEMCTTENFLQKDLRKPCSQPNASNVIFRYDNNTVSNETRHKQVNKNSRDQFNDTKYQKSALQAELAAKKRELEDLMGKHKAGTSNLNHDVGMDNKSEFSSSTNINNENLGTYWDRFSSDECQDDINEYTEINESQNSLPIPAMNFSPSNTSKQRLDNHPRVEYPVPIVDYERVPSVSRTPERNVRSSSVATSGYVRERSVSNNEQDNKMQVHKQLQLIKSVCESMIEQQSHNGRNSQQLRNNLTPSPLYSEPRRFASPNAHSLNALNVVNTNPCSDAPWHLNTNTTTAPTDFAHYQSWLTTNTLQTQSFMLNTLNQCCQMLWLQQRELAGLRTAVSMLQERVDGVPYENSTNVTPATPNLYPNQYHRPPPPPPPNQKTNQVSAACSMPNLNHYNMSPSNLEPTYTTSHHNNAQSGRLIDASLNNFSHINVQHQQNGEHSNNPVLHGVNTNQNLPGQLWNGQALNNQVAPGNRANNYWDNFRSYSRQNLLSTKNNDGFQNLPTTIDRSNSSSAAERPIPYTMMSFSKSNSEQESTRSSQENTPQRCGSGRAPRHMENHSTAIPPPDVLNVNHNLTKTNETILEANQGSEELNLGFQMLFNAYNDTSSTHSNLSEEQIFKDCIPEQCRRRNEWNSEMAVEEPIPKTKLFDELRENVYKEVASLISANEARPHFLIQLFRDLQMIGSDSLRLKILQSIQTVITHSLLNTSQPCGVGRPATKPQNQASNESGPNTPPQVATNGFSMQSTVWSKPVKNKTCQRKLITIENENGDIPNPLREIIPFLNDHEGEVFQHNLKIRLKEMLLESESFKEIVKDSVFQKHVSNVLDEVLDQYHGTKLHDVKMHLIQSLTDLFRGEISFIQLIQETTPDCNVIGVPNAPGTEQNVLPHIQNGDLAEADQSRGGETENEEEEGAVGGFLDVVQQEIVVKSDTKDNSEDNVDLPTIDFPSNAEGLDQVPTRLPTKSKSRSATPNKDRSSSRQETTEPF